MFSWIKDMLGKSIDDSPNHTPGTGPKGIAGDTTSLFGIGKAEKDVDSWIDFCKEAFFFEEGGVITVADFKKLSSVIRKSKILEKQTTRTKKPEKAKTLWKLLGKAYYEFALLPENERFKVLPNNKPSRTDWLKKSKIADENAGITNGLAAKELAKIARSERLAFLKKDNLQPTF